MRPDTTRPRPNNLASRPHRPRGGLNTPATNTPDNNNQRYAASSHSELRYAAGCTSALIGLVTLRFDLETGVRVASEVGPWGTFIPNLDTLGLRVLELFAMYATDKTNASAPFPMRAGP